MCGCREACEQSLKDLGIDKVDLLYQHQPDKSVPIEDSVRGMAVSATLNHVDRMTSFTVAAGFNL